MTLLPRLSRMTIAAVSVMAVLALGATTSSAGPINPQASAGWYTESDAFFLGAGANFGVPPFTITPNFEWIFVDSGSAYSLNVDGTMTVFPLGVANVYAGAGLGWMTVDPEQGDSNSDTVVNLIAGAGLNAIPLKPFGQFKYVIVDGNDPLVFSFGVRF